MEMNLDLSGDTIRDKLASLYGFDLCCSRAFFKKPHLICKTKGYLKILVDYDYHYCKDCGIPSINDRGNIQILLNNSNRIYFKNHVIQKDSLKNEILSVLSKIGNDDDLPESYKMLYYQVSWIEGCSKGKFDSVLTSIYMAHLEFVVKRESVRKFEKLNKNEIDSLKNEYPLNIEFPLGKYSKFKPKIPDNLNQFEEIINNVEKDFILDEPKR